MTTSILSDSEFQKWNASPGTGDYGSTETWAEIGALNLDKRLAHLADLYLESGLEKRTDIRAFFEGNQDRLDEMWLFVRRVAKLLEFESDPKWVRRALAVAEIEGGRVDYRDSVVSLVLLRYGAERVGIDPRPLFDTALLSSPSDFTKLLKNARDHASADVQMTVREFGPGDWSDGLGGT